VGQSSLPWRLELLELLIISVNRVKVQNLIGNSNDMDAVWDEIIQISKKGYPFTLDWYKNHLITKELLKGAVLHGIVLDIGCGLGDRAFLASAECTVIGIDFSWVAIKYATKHFGHNFCIGNILTMPFRDQTFDNAFMLATIEHIVDLRTLISEISRILRPLGKLFVSVTQRNYHAHVSHVHKFTKISLIDTFKPFVVLKSCVKEHIIFATIQF